MKAARLKAISTSRSNEPMSNLPRFGVAAALPVPVPLSPMPISLCQGLAKTTVYQTNPRKKAAAAARPTAR
jgi:hypothetical protein